MLNNLYTNYFAKDRPLRHPTQHLIAATFGFLVTSFIFGMPINTKIIFIFFLFTYIPDIDGLASVLWRKNKALEANEIVNFLKNKKLKEAAIHATTHHKKFNKLLIHNVVGFAVVLTFYLIVGFNKNYVLLSIFGATLTHFIFDIADDIYQLGNINNWLWPYFAIFKRRN